MKYTNDLNYHDGKWYARIEFASGDIIPAGCYLEDGALYCFNTTVGKVPARNWTKYSGRLYAPVVVPEGFPEKWTVLKDGDVISEKTISYELAGLAPVHFHYWGSYEEKCREYSIWDSVLMFNPVATPQENFANAEKSGIVDAFKNGKAVQSSRDGKNWSDEPTPNFCLPLQWRIKRDPIKPPVFDWRPIEECDLATKVLVKTRAGNILTAKRNGNSFFCEFSGAYTNPTHFTVIE